MTRSDIEPHRMPVTPSIVAWARERAGYSLSEAQRHFSSIHRWETGELLPTYPQLEQMSERFKVPVAVFFFPEPPDTPKIDETFRTLPHNNMERIPPRIRLLLRKARAMQISLSELNDGENPVPRFLTSDLQLDPYDAVESMVRGVREYLQVGVEEQFSWGSVEHALENWRRILTDHGVFVFKDAFREPGFFGFCLYDREFPIIYVNKSSAKSRQIFTVFHELAHLMFHTSGIDLVDDEFINILSSDNARIEIVCNEFAGRCLVPDDAFDLVSAGLPANEGTAEQLASRFCVSREVIFRKFLERRLITQSEYSEAAERWSSDAGTGSEGGDYYYNQMAYLGQKYIGLAFERYYQNRFDVIQLADYLNIKPKSVQSLEERYLKARAT